MTDKPNNNKKIIKRSINVKQITLLDTKNDDVKNTSNNQNVPKNKENSIQSNSLGKIVSKLSRDKKDDKKNEEENINQINPNLGQQKRKDFLEKTKKANAEAESLENTTRVTIEDEEENESTLKNFTKKTNLDLQDYRAIFSDYLTNQNMLFPASPNNQILHGEYFLEEMKEIKKLKKSVKSKIKGAKKNGGKSKVLLKKKEEIIYDMYTKDLDVDRSEDSDFEDDLFYLRKSNEEINLKKYYKRKLFQLSKRKFLKKNFQNKKDAKHKKNPFLCSIEDFIDYKDDQTGLQEFIQKTITTQNENKGVALFNDANDEIDNNDDPKNIYRKENKYKRTFNINFEEEILSKAKLIYEKTLLYRLIPLYWVKTPNFEIYDNYSDAYSIVFSRFKKEGEEYYTNRFNEGYQRYQELLKKENEEELMLDKNQANNMNNVSEEVRKKAEADRKKRRLDMLETKIQEFQEDIDDRIKQKALKNNITESIHEEVLKNYNIMQRLYKYNHDLRTILKYWIEHTPFLKKKKQEYLIKNVKKDKDDEELNTEIKLIKKINKKEVTVKYGYKIPDQTIKNLIPLCNDIFTISKKDD